MKQGNRPSIVVIDKQDTWRKRFVDILAEAGYDVTGFGMYDDFFSGQEIPAATPNLVLLGCAKVGATEMRLIRHIMENGYPVLVLSSTLSRPDMRALFLAGARDVDNKSYDAQHFLNTVDNALRSLPPRDSYEALAREERGA